VEAQWYIHQAMAWIEGENQMSIILFIAAMFCGFIAGRVSAKNATLPLADNELKLTEKLTVAQNLNNSLLVDLQEAKQTIWKLKNAS
jgi:hypothetical protein